MAKRIIQTDVASEDIVIEKGLKKLQGDVTKPFRPRPPDCLAYLLSTSTAFCPFN